MTPTKDIIKRLRENLKAANPPELKYFTDADDPRVCRCNHDRTRCEECLVLCGDTGAAMAELVASSINNMPTLLTLLEALDAECEAWRERHRVDGTKSSECWDALSFSDYHKAAMEARAATDAAREAMGRGK